MNNSKETLEDFPTYQHSKLDVARQAGRILELGIWREGMLRRVEGGGRSENRNRTRENLWCSIAVRFVMSIRYAMFKAHHLSVLDQS